jgi:hypothetical protein
MSLLIRILSPFLLAAWIWAAGYILAHADSAPSSHRIAAQRSQAWR